MGTSIGRWRNGSDCRMERKLIGTYYNPVLFPTLYHRSKTGKVSVWELSVQLINKIPTIVTCFGYENGVKQTAHLKIPYGKNIGRSNQTTPWEQAVSEAKAKWEKKQLENYRISLEEEIHVLPMLAHKYTDHFKKVVWPCYVQPKLNGVRVLTHIKDGKAKYISRKSKEYETLHHWDDELINLFPDGTILDGEAFHPDLSFQEIIRRIKRVKTSRFDIEDNELQYWIYDVINAEPYQQRLEFLRLVLTGNEEYLEMCPTFLIHDDHELKKRHAQFTQAGFEGSIIRNVHGLYQVNYRSYDLLKYKDFIDKEYRIVGGTSATGKDEGTVIFQCITDKHQIFNVRPRGTWKQRKEYLDDIQKLTGKILTVRYQEMSEDGIPIFPIGLCIRNYE